MTQANKAFSRELFYEMTEGDANGCLLWTGKMNKGYPQYYAPNLVGGSVRAWVWKELLGYEKAPRVRWPRRTREVKCDDRCLQPAHLLRLLDYCPSGHLLTPGSEHLGVYPGTGERYCRTCKFDSFKKQKYGLTPSMEAASLAMQEGFCAVCKNPLEKIYRDHNHASGKFRGLLCQQCNSGLGMFRDNIEYMKSAIAYIEDDGNNLDEYMSQFVRGE